MGNFLNKKGTIMTQIIVKKAKTLRGRPRVRGALREANGRIVRAKNPVQNIALLARMRHYGLSKEAAGDVRAENYLGRLSLLGSADGLSRKQYEAAQRFLAVRNDYQKSLLSPGAYYEEMGLGLATDEEEKDYQAWVQRVRRRYAAALRAVQEAQNDNGAENLYAALHYVVIEGLDLPHLLGSTRMVLNALHRHFTRTTPQGRRANSTLSHHISLAGMVDNLPAAML